VGKILKFRIPEFLFDAISTYTPRGHEQSASDRSGISLRSYTPRGHEQSAASGCACHRPGDLLVHEVGVVLAAQTLLQAQDEARLAVPDAEQDLKVVLRLDAARGLAVFLHTTLPRAKRGPGSPSPTRDACTRTAPSRCGRSRPCPRKSSSS